MLDREVFQLRVVVEINDDGYLARSPGIQGAFAEGDTIKEAIFNCVDVVKMIAAYRADCAEPTEAAFCGVPSGRGLP